MQQLISENIRYSEESDKRVEMINKAINDFGISGKGKSKGKGEVGSDEKYGKKMVMASSINTMMMSHHHHP